MWKHERGHIPDQGVIERNTSLSKDVGKRATQPP